MSDYVIFFKVFTKSSRPFPAPPKSSASDYLVLEPLPGPANTLIRSPQVSNTAPQGVDWIVATRDARPADVKACEGRQDGFREAQS
jgi:hypothetical protein